MEILVMKVVIWNYNNGGDDKITVLSNYGGNICLINFFMRKFLN